MRIATPPAPGAVRLTLSALVIVVATLVGRAGDRNSWWWIAGGVVLLIGVLGWWRGVYLTTIVRRRLTLTVRNMRSGRGVPSHGDASATDARTTVLLKVGAGPIGGLPLRTIATYLDRYGVRCAGIRVTSHDPERATWIGLTISAVDNLRALQARSAKMPLHQTAQVVGRRLADHLRELGWIVQLVDTDDIPWPVTTSECWRGAIADGGHVAAYRVKVDASLPETLSRIWTATEPGQTWTVLEITGAAQRPAITVGCAMLTADKPGIRPPVAGLTPEAGNHGPALDALHPASTEPVHGQPHSAGELLTAIHWDPISSSHAVTSAST